MFVKCQASGAVVGGLIALAAMSRGYKMGLDEPEFGWIVGIGVAALGVCAGLLVFLIFLTVGLVVSRSKPPRERQAAEGGPPETDSEQGGAGQPATRPELKSEDSQKSQLKAEGRSR
jgi:hypothetical protein